MSRSSTSVKVMGSSKSSTKYHVGIFTTDVKFGELKEPVSLQRKPDEANDPKKPSPLQKFHWQPSAHDPKSLPLILEDGAKRTTNGVYEEPTGSYVMLVKEGNVFRAYPIASWFKFGAFKDSDVGEPGQPAPKLESVNTKLVQKLGALMKDEGVDKSSRVKATHESRFQGGTEDGDELGEDMDFEEKFDSDEGVKGQEEAEEEADKEDVAPKKLSKLARKELERIKGADGMDGDANHNQWVYDLLYGEEEEEEEEGDAEAEEEAADAASAVRRPGKRSHQGADEGREPKRVKKGIVQDEQFRKDRHSVITALRTAFLNSPQLESAQIIKILRNSIPNFAVGDTKPGLDAAETQRRQYWTFILKEVLLEKAASVGGNKFKWKDEQK